MIKPIPALVLKKSAITSSNHRYSVFNAGGGHDFGVEGPHPTGQRRRDGVNRISSPEASLFVYICAQMPREPVAPDQGVLRRRTFGVVFDIRCAARAAHHHIELHQVTV